MVEFNRRTFREVNPMVLAVSLICLAITYLVFAGRGVIIDSDRTMYALLFIGIIVFAFLNREKRLITLREAKEIAINDARMSQNEGEIEDMGKLVIVGDGVLRRITKMGETTYDAINVAVGVESKQPVIYVYTIDCWNGYIIRISKREYWDSQKDPDLKIIIPPQWLDFLKAGREMTSAVDLP